MSNSQGFKVFITAVGLVCPAGLSAPAACAAMRAGMALFSELPYRDNAGEPIVGAFVPSVQLSLTRDNRLIDLLTAALRDCLDASRLDSPAQVPLLIGLAEPGRPGGGAALADVIVRQVEERLGLKFHSGLSRAIPLGHTAGFAGLKMAREILNDPKVPACVVAGVDSYINASALRWLSVNDRLKTADYSDGVIPGEAAAAVVVRREPSAESTMRVIGMGFGKETAHILCDEPLLGQGLTAAARSALAEAKFGLHEIDWRISDVTGEQYGFKEIPLVEGRLVRIARKEPQPLWHCADSIGDSGAAAGVVQLVVVYQAYRKGYAPGDKAICLTSSVPGDRAALITCRGMGQAPAGESHGL